MFDRSRNDSRAAGGAPTWRIEITASNASVDALESVIESNCGAVSRFTGSKEADWRIEGFAESKPNAKTLFSALAQAAAACGDKAPRVYIHRLEPRDWGAENLAFFPPLGVGRYFIYPTHHQGDVLPGPVSMCLNPGPAFGSGEHASTSGCLLALDWLARRRRFKSALDMGCGSGILALAIAKTWKIPVLAVDSDQKAVMTASGNFRLNKVARLARAAQSMGYRSLAVRQGAPYDLIVCNILANPLKSMASDLVRCLSVNGVAVLSGFLEGDGSGVLFAYRARGLRLLRHFDKDGWRTLMLARGRA